MRSRESQAPQGPAASTKTSVGVRRARSDTRVDVTRASADGASEDHLGGPLFRGIRHGAGLLMDIQTDGKGAHVTPG